MNKKSYIIIAIVLLLIIFAAIMIAFVLPNGDKATLTTSSKPNEEETVSICGFSHLYFKSNTTEQVVDFENPKGNKCAMDMELQLENGEVIWSGKNLMPGYSFKNININKELTTGEYYNSKLVVKCIDLKTGEQLNGCEIVFTLNVD